MENKLLENFKEECKLINLKYEYPGYTGIEKWLIITDLSEGTLIDTYKGIIEKYKPYILMTKEQGAAITSFDSNEKKHYERNLNLCDMYGYEDDTFETYHPEMICDFFNEYYHKYDDLQEALIEVKPLIKKRIYKYYFLGYSYTEIAYEENVSVGAVKNSIERTLKQMKIFINKNMLK